MGVDGHMTPDTGQMRLTEVYESHALAGWGRRTAQASQGHMGAACGKKGNKQRLWEANFVVSRVWGAPWFPHEDVIGLFE